MTLNFLHIELCKQYNYFCFKVFPDGLMDDMASKNISNCTVSYTALPMKTDLHN